MKTSIYFLAAAVLCLSISSVNNAYTMNKATKLLNERISRIENYLQLSPIRKDESI